MDTGLDSQARATSTNSCLCELILCFIHMNIYIILRGTKGIGFGTVKAPFNIDSISTDRFRQLPLNIHTWALWADILWDGREWRDGIAGQS